MILRRELDKRNAGLNLYGFVRNSSTNLIDPFGLTSSSTSSSCCCKITVIIKVPSGNEGDKKARKGMAGHVGIAVGSEYYDYGPQPGRGASLIGSEGRPWWDQMVPGGDASLDDIIIGVDSGEFTHGLEVFLLSIDAKQIECQDVRNYWRNLYNNPGTYRWYGKTCTTTATKSLIEAGIYDGGMVRKPVTLMKKLIKSFKHTCGSKKGSAAYVKQIYP